MSTARRGGVDNIILISGDPAGNDPVVLAGIVDPSAGGGVAAVEGSFYLRYAAGAGEVWYKSGAANTAWTQIVPGGLILPKFTGNDAIFPSTNPASATSRNQHALIAFDDITAENILLESVMPKGYAGENLNVNLHWIAATAIVGNVQWGVQWERDQEGGHDLDADSFAAQQTVTRAAPGTSGVIDKAVIPFTQAQADAIAGSNPFRLRVTRNAAAGVDTMVGDAQLLRVSIEVA